MKRGIWIIYVQPIKGLTTNDFRRSKILQRKNKQEIRHFFLSSNDLHLRIFLYSGYLFNHS